MSKRKISLILCLVLLFSALAPAALAADLETPVDDPVEPDPYLYISSIYMSLTISNGGRTDNYCRVYVPNTDLTIELTLTLQRSSDGGDTWSDVSTYARWTASGTEIISADGPWYVTHGYTYRDKATISLYTSDDLLAEGVTEYSNYVYY